MPQVTVKKSLFLFSFHKLHTTKIPFLSVKMSTFSHIYTNSETNQLQDMQYFLHHLFHFKKNSLTDNEHDQ